MALTLRREGSFKCTRNQQGRHPLNQTSQWLLGSPKSQSPYAILPRTPLLPGQTFGPRSTAHGLFVLASTHQKQAGAEIYITHFCLQQKPSKPACSEKLRQLRLLGTALQGVLGLGGPLLNPRRPTTLPFASPALPVAS